MNLSQDPKIIKEINPAISSSDIVFIKAIISVKENGKDKIIARPEVFAHIGKEAVFTTEGDNGERFELSVTPVHKKL